MLVGRLIEDLPRIALAPDQTRATQQTQVVADERRRSADICCDLRDRTRPVEAGDENPQAGRVAEKPESLGEQFDIDRAQGGQWT